MLEREAEAGRHPAPRRTTRASALRDLRRLLSGPAYARRYAELARAPPAPSCCTETMVTGWTPGGALELTGPRGRTTLDAGARSCSPPAAASARARRGWCPAAGPRA